MQATRNNVEPLPRVSGNLEPIGAYLDNMDGTPFDLTGFDAVVFRMVDTLDATVIVNDAAATVLDAAAGQVQYQPTGTETTLRSPAKRARYEMYWLAQKSGHPDRRFPYDGGYQLILFQEACRA